MASSSSGNRARMDQIVGEFMAKGLHVVLDARLEGAAVGGGGGSARESEGPAARWFNLGLPAPGPQVGPALDAWRRAARNTGGPLVVEVLLVKRATPTRSDAGAAAGPSGRPGMPHRPFSSPDAFISLLAHGNVPVQGGTGGPSGGARYAEGVHRGHAGFTGPAAEGSGDDSGWASGGEVMSLVERWVIWQEKRMGAGGVGIAGVGGPGFGAAGWSGSGGASGRGMGPGRSASALDVSNPQAAGGGVGASGGDWQAGAGAGELQDAAAGLEVPIVYKHLVVLLRSVYSLARTLPAYRLHKSLTSTSHQTDYKLAHRIVVGPAAAAYAGTASTGGGRPGMGTLPPQQQQQQPAPGSPDSSSLTHFVNLPSVDMPGGRLGVNVSYCHTTTVTAVEVAPPLIPHLITDYVGSPLTDSVRRYSQSDAPLSPAAVSRRAVHVIPIVASASTSGAAPPGGPSPSSLPSRPSSLPLDALISPSSQRPTRRNTGPASGALSASPAARFPQARSLSGTAASFSPSPSHAFLPSPGQAVTPAGTSAPSQPSPIAEQHQRMSVASPSEPGRGPRDKRQPGTGAPGQEQAHLRAQLEAQQQGQVVANLQTPQQQQQQQQERHQKWQQDLLRQNQQQSQGSGPWHASAPLSIPRPSPTSSQWEPSTAEGPPQGPDAHGIGEARKGGDGYSRTSGFQLQTIGTAPQAVVAGPVPFLAGASPARPWLPASAPGHAPGVPMLGADWPRAQGAWRGGGVSRGGGGEGSGLWEGSGHGRSMEGIPEGAPQGHQGLDQAGQALSSKPVSWGGGPTPEGTSGARRPTGIAPSSRGSTSIAPSSALTAALTALPAVTAGPTHSAPLGAESAGASAAVGAGGGVGTGGGLGAAPMVYGGHAPQVQMPQQRPWGLERQLSTSSDVHSSRQSLRPPEEDDDDGNMDLPFAVDDDEEEVHMGPPRTLSNTSRRSGGGSLEDRAGAFGAPPGSLGSSGASQAQSRAGAAVGSLVKMLKSAPPLRSAASAPTDHTASQPQGGGPFVQTSPGQGSGAPEGASGREGHGGAQLHLGFGQGSMASSFAWSSFQDAGAGGRWGGGGGGGAGGNAGGGTGGGAGGGGGGAGAQWPAYGLPLGASLSASSVASSSAVGLAPDGPWHSFSKSVETALAELEGFQELRDTLVLQQGLGPPARNPRAQPHPHTHSRSPAHSPAHSQAQSQAQSQAHAQGQGRSGAPLTSQGPWQEQQGLRSPYSGAGVGASPRRPQHWHHPTNPSDPH